MIIHVPLSKPNRSRPICHINGNCSFPSIMCLNLSRIELSVTDMIIAVGIQIDPRRKKGIFHLNVDSKVLSLQHFSCSLDSKFGIIM